jgi:hypothetical protein
MSPTSYLKSHSIEKEFGVPSLPPSLPGVTEGPWMQTSPTFRVGTG